MDTPSRELAVALDVQAATPPTAPFLHLTTLWIQITGTWCNLRCTHCINASGPTDPWLPSMDTRSIRRAIQEAETLGVKEIYFTGGEPFLHPEILPLLKDSLAVAPTSVLTNGTRIDVRMAAALARLAEGAAYSLDIRVSLDDVDEQRKRPHRGRGAWRNAVRAIQLLAERGILPIVTATELLSGHREASDAGMYQQFRDFLRSLGITKARVKVLPVFAAGRLVGMRNVRLTEADLDDLDRSRLQCADARVVAADGVYTCTPARSSLACSERSCRTDTSSTPSDRPRSTIRPVLRAMRRACRAEPNERYAPRLTEHGHVVQLTGASSALA
jgi:MoaA/NifB/PqqE/SkfB family radical SAM enzyme